MIVYKVNRQSIIGIALYRSLGDNIGRNQGIKRCIFHGLYYSSIEN